MGDWEKILLINYSLQLGGAWLHCELQPGGHLEHLNLHTKRSRPQSCHPVIHCMQSLWVSEDHNRCHSKMQNPESQILGQKNRWIPIGFSEHACLESRVGDKMQNLESQILGFKKTDESLQFFSEHVCFKSRVANTESGILDPRSKKNRRIPLDFSEHACLKSRAGDKT